MEESEFQAYLPKFRELLKFVLENPYSDFYREKYKGLDLKPENIKTYEDFCKIPMLTKDEILSIPTDKRIFVPIEEVIRYSVSSGTTNQNRPLVLPHIMVPFKIKNRLAFHDQVLKDLNVDKLFGLMPINSVMQSIVTNKERKLPVFTADIHKLDLCVSIAKELNIQAIMTSPTILYVFTEKLKKTDFDRSQVKWISIGSEYCTTQKFKYFKENYPNAFFYVRYGNSECGAQLGYRCDYLANAHPQIFHPTDCSIMEVVKFDELKEGIGEIVFTHLYKEGFPLIRYKTGDYATETPCNCKCGQKRIIDTSGKIDSDILKTSGVIIHTQAVADAVASVSEYVEDDFQIHVYEEAKDGGIVTKLVLELIPKKEITSIPELARFVEDQMMVAFGKSLHDIVVEGFFLPLEIKLVPDIKRGEKSKHIISHLHHEL